MLLTFILAMVLHPEVLVKAQKEIDSITGGERLPELEDRENMPYLQHVIMEVYRYANSLYGDQSVKEVQMESAISFGQVADLLLKEFLIECSI